MRSIGIISCRPGRLVRSLALALGVPGLMVTVLAMTAAPATAATAGKALGSAAAVSAAQGRPAAALAPREPGGQDSPDGLCLQDMSDISRSAGANVLVGASETLTVTTTCNIGPTADYMQFYDVTTGALVEYWGSGTSFSLTVSESVPTTQEYIACLGSYSTTYSASDCGYLSQYVFVTWEAAPGGVAVSLSGPTEVATGGTGTYTATASENVGPTPYYIEIFNVTTDSLLGYCGTGTTCSVSFAPDYAGDDLVAFVSYASASVPPSGTQANSFTLGTYEQEPLP